MLLWPAGQDFWCAVSSFWRTQRLIEIIPICQFFQIFPGAERYFEGSAFPCWNASNCLCGQSTSIPLLIQYFGGVLTNKHKVLDPYLGWSDFRNDYGSARWQWLAAATRAR